jgi:hypothetical protein
MSYFQNTKFVPYRFGSSEEYAFHQDLTSYVDLIDQVRDNSSFYQRYTILDGDRADVLSQKLYGSPKYYWTFFLMNAVLRESGWPMRHQELEALTMKERHNTVLTTRADLTGVFNVGDTVTGATSAASGVVFKRNLDLGQIFVTGHQSFLSTEDVQDLTENSVSSVSLVSAVAEYNAVYEYVDVDQRPTDISPYAGPGAQLSAVTYLDRYIRENDALKDIVVIKPSAIAGIFEQFQEAMRE